MSELTIGAEQTLHPPKFTLVNNIPEGTLTDSARIHRDLIANAYRAMLSGESNALAELLDPDVEFREAEGLPYGQNAKGIEATLRGVAEMFEPWESVHCTLIEVCGGEEMAIAYMNLKNVARATGKTYEGVTCEVFRFRNGKIVEWHPVYWDTHKVREVCGVID